MEYTLPQDNGRELLQSPPSGRRDKHLLLVIGYRLFSIGGIETCLKIAGLLRIAEYSDGTRGLSRNPIDLGSPRPNAGEGPGVRGEHTGSTRLINPAEFQTPHPALLPQVKS